MQNGSKQETSFESFDILKKIYQTQIKPVEQKHSFHLTHGMPFREGEFGHKPLVLFLGQYSTGKTAFITNLLGKTYPGAKIGPEPTTENINAVMYGKTEKCFRGSIAAMDRKSPFAGLEDFGKDFLRKFFVSALPQNLLENIILVDTPGIMTEKTEDKGNSLEGPLAWLIEHADLIFVLFDITRIDMASEVKTLFQKLENYTGKVRIVLNKTDIATPHELLRVYGALTWSLSRILPRTEIPLIYIAAAAPHRDMKTRHTGILEENKKLLLAEFNVLTQLSLSRKLEAITKRMKELTVFIHLTAHLKKKLPMWGKEKKQRDLLQNIKPVFEKVAKKEDLDREYFPDPAYFTQKMKDVSFEKFTKKKKQSLQTLENVATNELARFMPYFPRIDEKYSVDRTQTLLSVFEEKEAETWKIDMEEYLAYKRIFENERAGKKISEEKTKKILKKMKLPDNDAAQIWNILDTKKRRELGLNAFCAGMYLARARLQGEQIPERRPKLLTINAPSPTKKIQTLKY
ncbi:MAG: EH domain-containing protein [Amphiamblys sp. WSBS2006]|nr:MAG: EH domain-containing protein [Amphiamblys sp. WSBS2006]